MDTSVKHKSTKTSQKPTAKDAVIAWVMICDPTRKFRLSEIVSDLKSRPDLKAAGITPKTIETAAVRHLRFLEIDGVIYHGISYERDTRYIYCKTPFAGMSTRTTNPYAVSAAQSPLWAAIGSMIIKSEPVSQPATACNWVDIVIALWKARSKATIGTSVSSTLAGNNPALGSSNGAGMRLVRFSD